MSASTARELLASAAHDARIDGSLDEDKALVLCKMLHRALDALEHIIDIDVSSNDGAQSGAAHAALDDIDALAARGETGGE